ATGGEPSALAAKAATSTFRSSSRLAAIPSRSVWSATRLNEIMSTWRITLRGRDETLRTSGICNEKTSGLRCFVECDGSGVDVVPRARDTMMYLDCISVAASRNGSSSRLLSPVLSLRHGFLSHLRSLEGYNEPEILPSSTHPICLMSADGGQFRVVGE